MYIHGSYCNERDVEVKVEILTHGDRTKEVEIGGEGSDISWSEDPVETSTQVNDSFDVLLMSQASVRLLCRNYVEDFFCSSCKDAVVNIYREGVCLFAGGKCHYVPRNAGAGSALPETERRAWGELQEYYERQRPGLRLQDEEQ